MTGIKELADKLQAAANSKGIKKLGVDDIEAIVSMPNIPTVDQSLVDMSLQEFAQRSYGAKPTDRAAIEQEDNIINLHSGRNLAEKIRIQTMVDRQASMNALAGENRKKLVLESVPAAGPKILVSLGLPY